MQRLIGARGRLQLGPGRAEVGLGEREPSPDLPQYPPARRPREIRIKRDRVSEGGDVGQFGPLDQRIGSEVQRRGNRERHTVLYRDLDNRAHFGLGANQLAVAGVDRGAHAGGDHQPYHRAPRPRQGK